MEKVIAIVFIVFLVTVALIYEFHDFNKLYERPPAYLYDNIEERELEYKYFGCYSVFVEVIWRNSLIAAGSSAIFIYILLYILLNIKLSIAAFILIFIINFLIIYAANSFRSYHLYRDLCSKFNSDIIRPERKMVIIK